MIQIYILQCTRELYVGTADTAMQNKTKKTYQKKRKIRKQQQKHTLTITINKMMFGRFDRRHH